MSASTAWAAYYTIAPSYAFFLERLRKKQMGNKNCFDEVLFVELEDRIRAHFEGRAKDGKPLGLSMSLLLRPLRQLKNKETILMFAPERLDVYDSSTEFFSDLYLDLRNRKLV